MISIRKIRALYVKQFKNLMYNYFVLAGFFVPLAMSFLMRITVEPEVRGSLFIMMIQMSILLGGANTMCCLIAEEKEKNTLNVLMTSTVSSLDFLISNSLITSTFTILLNISIYLIIGGNYISFSIFLIVTTLATFIATVLGAVIGLVSKNQMSASTIASPIFLLLTFIPMVFSENTLVQNVLYFSFTEQVGLVLTGDLITFSSIGIQLINTVVFIALFAFLYKKKGFSE